MCTINIHRYYKSYICVLYTHTYTDTEGEREDKSVYTMLPLVLLKKSTKLSMLISQKMYMKREKLREKSSVRGTLHVSPFVAFEYFFNEKKNAN